ncbi:MAG: HAD family phosphatase [Clostridium sp.]|nr:HAD family phosphatase [Clostridium sp.]MCM1400291.1 HAD family phosphatase [Clostridium sp.]MCM1460466.1 HAD family phosphatase [Bacteroides sp.]
MKYDAVVFDMDGVIFDSEKKVVECWQVVAQKYDIEEIEKACSDCLGLNRVATKEYFLRKYGENFPYDEYKTEMSNLFHERYGNGKIPLKQGSREILGSLKKSGKRVALATSTRTEIVVEELKAAGLYDFFDAIVCGDMVEKSKPAPDIFLKACQCLDIKPCDSFAIEDSYNGVRSAHGAGIRTIMVPDLAPVNDEMRDIAETVLESLFDVMDYLGLK